MNLPALTLWPEWAWAICNLDKRVENRTWTPGNRLPIGSTLAIHAGKHIGGKPGPGALEDGLDGLLSMAGDKLGPDWGPVICCPKSAIVAVATIDGFDREQRTPWDVAGLWHWRLRDVKVLAAPIPCRGAQGIWMVKP